MSCLRKTSLERLPLYCKIGAYDFEAGYSLWKIRASLGRLKRLRLGDLMDKEQSHWCRLK